MKKTIPFVLLGILLALGAFFLIQNLRGDGNFYTVSTADLPESQGNLIRSRPAPDRVSAPGSSRSETIIYSTKTPNGEKAAASGTILLPKGRAPDGGWPVILFQHGTTGVADICAPSKGSKLIGNNPDLQKMLQSFLKTGYALALPDYQGLGTPGPHPYLIGPAQARSSLDILPAARQLFPEIGKKYAIVGYSQGGQAAIFTAASAKDYLKDYSLVGTVAYSPPSAFLQQAKLLSYLSDSSSVNMALVSYIFRSAAEEAGINPQELVNPRVFDSKDPVLSEDGYSFWDLMEKTCQKELAAIASQEGGLSPETFLTKKDWERNANLKKIARELRKMDPVVRFDKNLILVQGGRDIVVTSDFTYNLFRKLNNLNNGRVSYLSFPEGNHTSVLSEAKVPVDRQIRLWFDN